MQRAVDAVADPNPIRHGLDVDVGRAFADRLGKQEVHDLDDRRLLVDARAATLVGASGPELFFPSLEDTHLLIDVGGRPIRHIDRTLNFPNAADVQLGGVSQDFTEPVRYRRVARVTDHNVESGARPPQDQRAPRAGVRLGQCHNRNGIGKVVAQVHHVEARLFGQETGQVPLSEDSFGNEELAKALAGRAVRFERGHQVVGRQHIVRHQDLAQHADLLAGEALSRTGRTVASGCRCLGFLQPRVPRRNLGLERLDRLGDLPADAVAEDQLVGVHAVATDFGPRSIWVAPRFIARVLPGLQQAHGLSLHPALRPIVRSDVTPLGSVRVVRPIPPGGSAEFMLASHFPDAMKRHPKVPLHRERDAQRRLVTSSSLPAPGSSRSWRGCHGPRGSADLHRRS